MQTRLMAMPSGYFGTGWVPDPADARDYSHAHHEVRPLLQELGMDRAERVRLPPAVDLRPWCCPVFNQGHLNSCTANAAVAAVAYAERRARGKAQICSRLFLYKAERNLLLTTGDQGAYLRTALQALVVFGVPPEKYWPYHPALAELEPPSFCYAFAADFKTLRYYRHDPPGTSKKQLLQRVKAHLSAGIPALFGAMLFDSFVQSQKTGEIPCPVAGDRLVGGHAMLAVGYDDSVSISNAASAPGKARRHSPGAFLVQNSYGDQWGMNGFGWLPYDYLHHDLATDWWSILQQKWIDTEQFGDSGTQARNHRCPQNDRVTTPARSKGRK